MTYDSMILTPADKGRTALRLRRYVSKRPGFVKDILQLAKDNGFLQEAMLASVGTSEGVRVENEGYTPLHIAVGSKHNETTALLLKTAQEAGIFREVIRNRPN